MLQLQEIEMSEIVLRVFSFERVLRSGLFVPGLLQSRTIHGYQRPVLRGTIAKKPELIFLENRLFADENYLCARVQLQEDRVHEKLLRVFCGKS